MSASNDRIRAELKAANMKLWQLADELNVSEPTITRWMRHDLPEQKEREIMNIIAEYKEKACG